MRVLNKGHHASENKDGGERNSGQQRPEIRTPNKEEDRRQRQDKTNSPLPLSEGWNELSGVEPLKGLRTAEEILDRYRKPEAECPDSPGGVAFQSENGAKHSIREIAEASMGSTTVAKWRAGFEGVLKLVHHALFQTSLNLGSKRPPHLADGAVEWQECFESAVVGEVESDEITGATRLILTAKNPRATEAALKKYRLRIEKGMQQYFGRIVQVSVRSD